jgi:hypothetical protein
VCFLDSATVKWSYAPWTGLTGGATDCPATALKIDVICFSETSVSIHTALQPRRPTSICYLHRRETVKSLTVKVVYLSKILPTAMKPKLVTSGARSTPNFPRSNPSTSWQLARYRQLYSKFLCERELKRKSQTLFPSSLFYGCAV